jgi:hypothetical protein
VQQSGDVLKKKRPRLGRFDYSYELLEEPTAARVRKARPLESAIPAKESLSGGDAEGLTRRATDDNVWRCYVSAMCPESVQRDFGDVTGVLRGANDRGVRMIRAQCVASPPFDLNERGRSKACSGESEVESSGSSKERKDSRARSGHWLPFGSLVLRVS